MNSTLREETKAHYMRLKGCRTLEEFNAEGWGRASCPLCQNYLGRRVECAGCPVKKATGQGQCRGTPWNAMDKAIDSLKRTDMPLTEPLPHVVVMANWLESIEWKGVP